MENILGATKNINLKLGHVYYSTEQQILIKEKRMANANMEREGKNNLA